MTETFRSGRKCPCQGCPDRHYACSDHCKKPAFLGWKEEQEKIRKARQAYRQGAWLREEAYQPGNPMKRSRKSKRK